jgi:hypothetical protein
MAVVAITRPKASWGKICPFVHTQVSYLPYLANAIIGIQVFTKNLQTTGLGIFFWL